MHDFAESRGNNVTLQNLGACRQNYGRVLFQEQFQPDAGQQR